jgi:hypothetical protein
MPLDRAIAAPHIAYNTNAKTFALSFDCDRDGWRDLLDAAMRYYGLPDPNSIVIVPATGRAHITWFLTAPIFMTGRGVSPGLVYRLQKTRRVLTAMLNADEGYNGRLTRNPWARGILLKNRTDSMVFDAYLESASGLMHHTAAPNPKRVSLTALADATRAWEADGWIIERKPVKATGHAFDPNEWPKGTRLFHAARLRVLRELVYPGQLAEARDYATVRDIVEQEAGRLVGCPAGERARKEIALSITRYWQSSRPKKPAQAPERAKPPVTRRRRPMALDPSLTVSARQSIAGKATAQNTRQRTAEKIAAALDAMHAEGVPITQAAVAARTGMSVSTVRRHAAPNGKRIQPVKCYPNAPIYPDASTLPAAFPNPVPSLFSNPAPGFAPTRWPPPLGNRSPTKIGAAPIAIPSSIATDRRLLAGADA